MSKLIDRAKSLASKVVGGRPSSESLKEELRRGEGEVARLVSELDRAKAAATDAVMDPEGFAAAEAEVRRLVDELGAMRNRMAYLGQARLLAEKEERGAALEQAQKLLTAERQAHKNTLATLREKAEAESERHDAVSQELKQAREVADKRVVDAEALVKRLSDDTERERQLRAPLHRVRIEELQAERDEVRGRLHTGETTSQRLRGNAERMRADVARWRDEGGTDEGGAVTKEFGKEIEAIEAEASRLEDRSVTDKKRIEAIDAELHRLGA